MPFLSIPQRRILDVLLAGSSPSVGLTLTEVAHAVGLATPTVHAQLKTMLAAGLLEHPPRTSMDRGLTYRAANLFGAIWVDRENRLSDEWLAPEPTGGTPSASLHLAFPLLGRVRDWRARLFLTEWLDEADRRGLLPARVPLFGPAPALGPTIRIGVYGSCARGDAGPKGDLDILIATSGQAVDTAKLVDLAHELRAVSRFAEHYRAPDIQILDGAATIAALPRPFLDRLALELRTVHTNNQHATPLEAEVRRRPT